MMSCLLRRKFCYDSYDHNLFSDFQHAVGYNDYYHILENTISKVIYNGLRRRPWSALLRYIQTETENDFLDSSMADLVIIMIY